jgi:hypothetical protein
MPLKPLEPSALVTRHKETGDLVLRLAPLDLNGAPADLPLVSIVVAHAVRCLERPELPAHPGAALTLTERGRGVLDTACTTFAKAAPGVPDEDRRRARSFVHLRTDWAAYLHAALVAAKGLDGVPELIVCPVAVLLSGYNAVEREVKPVLANDYFMLTWES